MNNRKELEVLIAGRHAGAFICSDEGMLGFVYDEDYDGPDLSVGMPFEGREFWGKRVHAWFVGLLPDDIDVRRSMAVVADCSPNSVQGLLHEYGMDLPGAVQVVPFDADAARESSYHEVSPENIRKRLEAIVEAERISAVHRWTTRNEHWSLGGNQAKIALRVVDGKWYSCQGDSASNVIVKPGVTWLDAQALDECISMRLAKKAGLPVADVWLESFDGFDAIAVDRYDRITLDDGSVRRIHQEDFCQALGVVPEKKYAADGGPTSAAGMNLVAGDSSGRGRELFFDALVFNYLIAGTDAHAKNYSLLHTSRGAFRMAPLYDVASIAPYMKKGTVYRTAMSIGGENRVGWLRRSSLARFAKMHGLDQGELADRVDAMSERVKANLEPALNDFADCKGIDELASRLVPHVRALCDAAERNIRVDGKSFKPCDVARICAE